MKPEYVKWFSENPLTMGVDADESLFLRFTVEPPEGFIVSLLDFLDFNVDQEYIFVDTPHIREVAASIAKVYEYHATGGNLHVVVDDFNHEDRFLDQTDAFIEEDTEASEDQKAAERDCLKLLRSLPEDLRESALAIQRGLKRSTLPVWMQGEGGIE